MDRAVHTQGPDARDLRPSRSAGRPGRTALRYGATLLVVAATAAVAYPFRVDLYTVPFFLIAVIICAWYGGAEAGGVAVIAGAITIHFLFRLPLLEAGPDISHYPRLAQFVVIGGLFTYLIAARRRAELSLREARDELEAKVVTRTADLRHTNERLQQEVAERRHAEAVALQYERELRDVIEAVPAIVTRMSAEGPTEFISHRWQEFTGLSEEEGLGWKWEAVIHPDDRVRMGIDWRAAVVKGEVLETEIRLRRADGQYRWWFVRAVPVRDEGGTILKWYGTAIDIEDRKRAEEALRLSEFYLVEAERLTHTGSWAWDTHRKKAIYWSDEMFRIYGLDHQRAPPDNEEIARLVHPEDRADRLARLENAVREKADYVGNHRLLLPDGTLKYLHVIGHPVLDQAGDCVEVIGTTVDVTKRRRAEMELEKLNAELEQRVTERTVALEAANHELEAFSYSVSHDLRAPLRAVNGFAAIFAEEYGGHLPEAGRDLLCKIQEQARKMSVLIEDLLHFSRTTRQPLERRSVDLAVLAHECFAELGAQREGREIDFKVGALPETTGDQSLLHQVMLNLLGNAVKYTRGRSPARIDVGADECEGETVYFVKDNGAGFDMRYADRLFGVFQRLHSTSEFEGTGIGLAIVARIIHRHGGRVWAEGEVDKGATFFFTLDASGSVDPKTGITMRVGETNGSRSGAGAVDQR